MRAILSAFFGVALSTLVFGLAGMQALAIEMQPAAPPAVLSPVTKVSGRCRLWQHRCRELYPAGGGWRYRRCMALHGCRG
jgi:hypothetical protein